MRKNFPFRRTAVMLPGLVLLSAGLALFKLSATGNDPSTAFVLAVGGKLHLDLAVMLPLCNALWFIAELLGGRKYIGIGTFANWLGVGPMASLFITLLSPLLPETMTFGIQLLIVVIGIPILCLGCSMYQAANLGIAPYDALAMILEDRLPLPYFWCRIIVDSICALCAFLLGGVIGLGTLVCALGLGPIITLFTNTVSNKLCGYPSKKA